MENCVFCKIVRGEIPKEFRYKDDLVVAFDDITPAKPVHILFVPKVHIEDYINPVDPKIFVSVQKGVERIVEEKELLGKGYRVLVNGGGAQIINHLHFHLMGPVGLKSKF